MIRRLAFASLICLPVFAQAPRASAAEHAIAGSVVHVYVAGPPESLARTQATLRELLARIQFEAVVERASDESVLASAAADAAPRAFLDFRSTAAPRIVLVDSPSGKELERRTLPASTSLEVAVEEAAHVLYMALESSQHARADAPAATAQAGKSAGSAPPDSSAGTPGATEAPPLRDASSPARTAAASAAPNAAAPPAGSAASRTAEPTATAASAEEPIERGRASGRGALPLEAGLSAFGGFSSFDAAHVLPGVGGALDAGLGRAPLRVAAWLSFSAFFPATVTQGAQSGSVRAEAFRLAALAEWFAWPRASFLLGAGGGADHVTFDAGPSTAAVQSGGVDARTDPVLEALGGIRLRISSALGAFALAALDVDLTPHHYVTETGDQTTTFFALPRVRPAAYIGLTYVFYDASAAASRERSP